MHAVLDLLKELNQKQKLRNAGARYPNSLLTRIDEIIDILQAAGFSVVFHQGIEKWVLYYEDREK